MAAAPTREIPTTELTRGHWLVTISGPKEVSYVDWASPKVYVVFMDGMTSPLDLTDGSRPAYVTILDK